MDGTKTPESKLDPGVQFGFQTESIGVGADHFAAVARTQTSPDIHGDRVFHELHGTVGKQAVHATWV